MILHVGPDASRSWHGRNLSGNIEQRLDHDWRGSWSVALGIRKTLLLKKDVDPACSRFGSVSKNNEVKRRLKQTALLVAL